MTFRRAGALALLASCAAATTASGQAPTGDPTLYCHGNGGPLGIATDTEHTVLVGDPRLPAGVSTRRVRVGGVDTRVQQGGPPTAQDAIVFVHGSPDSSRDWDDLVAAAGKFARTVAFDMPGYGQSDKDAAQLQTTDGAARYIQGVLDQLGIRRVVLVAHDFGGTWGLQWGVQHPDALIGAVLIDSGVLINYIPHPSAVIFSVPISGELYMASTTRDSFRQFVQANNPRPFPVGFVDRLYDDYDRAERCAILRYYRSASQNFSTLGSEQAAVLRKRSRPALVIWGEKDPYVPVEQAQNQRQAFPDARIETFADSGHFPHIDNAERTRGLVVPFLRPTLTASSPRARAGARVLQLAVSENGVLPAYNVTARVDRIGGGLAGTSGPPATVAANQTLPLRLRRALRPGKYRITVTAYGLTTLHVGLRVAAPRRRARPSLGSPSHFTG